MFDFTKRQGETDWQYKWRIYQAKASGLIDMDWVTLSAEIDHAIRPGEPEYNESVYRKECATVTGFYNGIVIDELSKIEPEQSTDSVNEASTDLKLLLEEIKQERYLLQDERTVANRALRYKSRISQQLDYLGELVAKDGRKRYVVSPQR